MSESAVNSARRKASFVIVCLLALVSIVYSLYCAYLRLRPESGLVREMNIYASIETNIIQASGGRAMAINFTIPKSSVAGYATNYYFLDVFTIWPQRVYVCPWPMVINNEFEILNVKFQPDDVWLHAHDAAGIINYAVIPSPNGSVEFHTSFHSVGSGTWQPLN